MDDPKQSEVEVASPITPDKDDSPPGGSVPGLRHASGLFLRSRQFSVSGGTFTNVTNIHRASDSPVDFRVIPLGDLDLLCKIDRGSGVVRRHRAEQAFTRRVYTARIPGLQSKVTAAVYQGDGAEEEWREEITRYANFRHPNVVQLYGVVKTQNLHAAVFHDDLIPCQDLKAKYYHSHVSAVYFWASLTAFSDVNNYMRPLLHRNLCWSEYTVWIRPSTGRPTFALTPPESDDSWRLSRDTSFQLATTCLSFPPISYLYLGFWRHYSIPENIPVKLGSIRHARGPEYGDSLEIVVVPGCRVGEHGWSTRDPIVVDVWNLISCDQDRTVIMENGWIRVNSGDVAEVYFRKIWVSHEGISSWLAQANHIFNRLYATCDLQNFICIDTIAYWLTFSASIDDLPPGYLFLCPLADFEFHLPGRLCMPDCPAYWSLDPAGAGHLSPVEARTVGFPDIQLRRAVLGKSWDDCDYAGTRQFHESNGFDAGSQEAAVAMGCPLVEITCDRDVWLAHIKANGACDESSESDVEEYHDFPEAEEDRESTTGSCAADPPKYSGCDDAGMDDESIFSCDEEPGINDVAGTRTADSDAEMFAPSRSWNIIMSVQFSLLFMLVSFSLYDSFCAS